MTPKILLLDIETAPSLGWVWGKYDQNVIEFHQDWYLLSFSVKWLGEKKVSVHALPDYPQYSVDKTNDIDLVKELWRYFDEADIIIAHNGDSFDIRKSNARFIAHCLAPPSSYKTVDTLKLARKYFKFDSNKLSDLAMYLDIGTKLPHTGFNMWKGCMAGDAKAWDMMKKYNAKDILLLEEVYLKLRPWAPSHPNLAMYTGGGTECCPTCTGHNTQRRGFSYTKLYSRQRFQCNDCKSWFTGKVAKKSDVEVEGTNGTDTD